MNGNGVSKEMDFADKVVVVTGGANGIGRSISLAFARRGANIVILDMKEDAALNTAVQLEALGTKSKAYKLDVSISSDVERIFGKIIEDFGKIDILVNNAGVTRDMLLMRMKECDWDLVLGVNLTGVFNCTKAVIRYMLKERAGKIVNIASIVGQIGNVGQANYSASKGGVIALTKTTAKEVASRGITVNAIAPGFIDTQMTKAIADTTREILKDSIPLKRLGQTEDVANAVIFLSSDMAAYITGQVIRVDGGMVM